jgi:biotin transport system substrate-specific component
MQVQGQSGVINTLSDTRAHIYIQVLWISLFAALTALGARFEIMQYPVPFTLQTFFVLLSGAFLGARNGALSQMVYLTVGAAGLPVFAAGGALGIMRLFGPTGGYLLAFPIAAFLVGYLVAKRTDFAWIFISMFAALIVIFSIGTVQLNFVLFNDWTKALKAGFLIFSWWDLLKLFAAASIFYQFARQSRRRI